MSDEANARAEVRDAGASGRGVFAVCDLSPGDIVLVERPFLTEDEVDPADSDPDVSLHARLARRALVLGDSVAEGLSALHPFSVDQYLEKVREEYAADGSLAYLTRPSAEAGEPFSEEEALLVMLKVRFNAFGSGLYLLSSMINHSCRPNCVKLAQGVDLGDPWTEFVAVRPIKTGEEVTINYTGTELRSQAGRSREFERQHLISLAGPSPFAAEREALLGGDADELEREAIETALDNTATGVESLLALRERAAKVFGPKHLVMVRVARVLHDEYHRLGPAAALDLVSNATPLVADLEDILGPTHHDLATVLQDLHGALEHLMGSDPKGLYALPFPEYANFSKASKASYAFKKKSEAIQKFFKV
jgi:hypothetical protein